MTLPLRAVHAPDVLDEAPTYPQPTSFSRGLRVEAPAGATHLFLSGTASIGSNGETLYPGDFGAQCWRIHRNLTGGATRLLRGGLPVRLGTSRLRDLTIQVPVD